MPHWAGEEAQGLKHIQGVSSVEKSPFSLGLESRPCFYSFHEKLPWHIKGTEVTGPRAVGCGFLD